MRPTILLLGALWVLLGVAACRSNGEPQQSSPAVGSAAGADTESPFRDLGKRAESEG